jgi:hypothetical protein
MGFYDNYRARVQSALTDSEYINDDNKNYVIDNFENQPNFYEVTKNADLVTTYKVLITEESKKNDAAGYKKLISYPYATTQFSIGDYIIWESDTWLLITLDSQYDYSVGGRIVETNIDLKWIDDSYVLQSYRACVDNKIYNVGNDETKYIFLPQGNIIIRVQSNADTRKLKNNNRFSINDITYRITNINNFINGLLEFYMEQVSESDNDAITPAGEILIMPEDVRSIIEGDTQIFTCFKFKNGIKQNDAFTFEVDASSQVSTAKYVLTTINGNSFSVKNNARDITYPLIVLCTDIVDATTQTVSIYLGGDW